jgi:hypothetical protein
LIIHGGKFWLVDIVFFKAWNKQAGKLTSSLLAMDVWSANDND